jgi:SAM-dependent methyltransferase
MFREHWERSAEAWIAWARTPDHDAYHDYAPRFFAEVVPEPVGRTLEIGCGEGRVARDLLERGHDVVAVDWSPTLLAAARDADARATYVRADAARLPFADASFHLVVAYNSLMDMDDLEAAVAEAARVLSPDGRVAVCVTHPVADAGAFDDRSPGSAFRIEGSYLGSRRFTGTFERAGLTITFDGMAHSLEVYANAFERAGLLIERLREPSAPADAIDEDAGEIRWTRVPLFLFVRAVKRPAS